MKPISVIDAPSVLGLFPRGVEHLPEALHANHLVEVLGGVDHRSLTPPPYSAERDPETGVNNAAAILSFADMLAAAIDDELDLGHFPVVLGGDCSIILGPLLALARRGHAGLLFLDGHADFSHPDEEPSGEAASMDLAIATGYCSDRIGAIGGFDPLTDPARVAVLGYRVHGDGTDNNRGVPVEDTLITTIDLDELRRRGLETTTADALAVVDNDDVDRFWIHIDADVLDDALMPAVDYRNPDGLRWEELTRVVRTAAAREKAAGLDLTIFNPNLDPGAALARRLVRFLGDALG